jgi:hypothetical protein
LYKEQEGRTVPAWGELVPVRGRGGQEMVKEGAHDANTVYTNINGKIISVETIPGMGVEVEGERWRG